MKQQDIEDARRDHVRYYNELWGGNYCRADHHRWPCRTIAALDEIGRLQFALKTASDQLAQAASYLSHSNQNHKAKWVQGWSDDARAELTRPEGQPS